ncbi:MAG: NAD(P)-dependent oxidoreductase [Fidelibacterota bacterium]
MRIAIIGASRGIGNQLLRLALEAGHEVTAFSRHPEKSSVEHEHLRVIAGDILDPDSVAAVTKGQDGVCVCIGIPPTWKPVTVFSEGIRNVLASIRKNTKLAVITGIGAGDSRGHGGFLYDHLVLPLLLKTIYQDKNRVEELLQQSSSNWLIVRPGFLTNNPRTGTYRVVEDLTGIKAGKISRADVADFILKQFETPTLFGKTPLLTCE